MNTTQLIDSIKRKTSMPNAQSLWTPARILASINEELQICILPLMMRIQEDYFLAYQSFTTYQASLPIPSRAIGTKIRSLGFYKDGYLQRNVPRLDEENTFLSRNLGFVFENYSAKLKFDQFPDANSELRLYYYKSPNTLDLETNVSPISAIDTATNIVTTSAALPFYIARTLINTQSPNNPFLVTAEDIEIISVNGASIELSSVEGMSVGDYVCENTKAFFPNIPLEMHSLLAQRVAVKVLEANGSLAEMAAAQGIYTQMERDAIYILTPRADGTTAKFTPGRGISAYTR